MTTTAQTIITGLKVTDPSTPRLAMTDEVFLVGSRASGTLTTVACAAAGAYTATAPIDVEPLRNLHTYIAMDSVTSNTTGSISILVEYCPAQLASDDADTADQWYSLAAWDGSLGAAAALGGALPASWPYTATPSFKSVTMERVNVLTTAVSLATDKLRFKLNPLDVSGVRYLRFLYAATVDTTHPMKVAISVVGSV